MNPIPGKCFRCGKKIEIGYTLCPKCASMLGAENRPTSFMTREEAIKTIQDFIGWFKEDSLIRKALEMAIKALSQEPCTDAVSRAELLKAIDTWDKFGVDDTNSLFRLDNLSLPHYVPYIHYDDVIKCIKGMPSVTHKSGKWIRGKDEYGTNHFTCPFCGHDIATKAENWDDNYCANCGADLRGAE